MQLVSAIAEDQPRLSDIFLLSKVSEVVAILLWTSFGLATTLKFYTEDNLMTI